MKDLFVRFGFFGCICLTSCSSEKDAKQSHRITDIPDTTLAQFSYSLIPSWALHKSTSFYDYRRPIIETSGSFTSGHAEEILVAVPYLSSEVPFTKLFLIKRKQASNEMIPWFSLDCTKFTVQDVNKDGVQEIIAEHEGLLSNITPYKTFELISLKNNEVNILYQNYSSDESKTFHKDIHYPGDTVGVWIETMVNAEADSTVKIFEIREYTTIRAILHDKIETAKTTDTILAKRF